MMHPKQFARSEPITMICREQLPQLGQLGPIVFRFQAYVQITARAICLADL